ncbi:YedE family putative selenium transporter [Spirochaetota bacterium]
MKHIKDFFATKLGIICTGSIIGILAVVLQKLGNPGNMGICAACFIRDIAGAVGLHRADVVQYVRPEIIGLVLGSFVAALLFKEFKPRTGSAPIVKFILGAFAMIGTLVFLGCPWRTILRLAGGDVNAVFGLLGLVFGIFIGTLFLRKGFNLGKAQPSSLYVGLLMPLIMLGLLVLMIVFPQIQGEGKNGILFYSMKGPGAMHAPIIISVIVGIVIGFLAQRTRFCTVGAFRDLIMFRQVHLLIGVAAFLVTALIGNLIFGQFNPGMEGQPVAHTQSIWNFTGMALAGLTFSLAGGCPGRNLFLAGEGNGDSAVFVLGMFAGAAFSHNFALAASPKGIGTYTIAALFIGFAFCLFIGFTMREKA